MSDLEYFEYISAPRVVFGAGSVDQVGRVAAKLKMRKPLLMIDGFFAGAGLVEKIKASLESEGLALAGEMSDIPQDSGIEVVRRGYEQAKDCGADGIIALGGGSVIDTAKGARIMMSEGGELPEGLNVLKGEAPPLIAIPTTAGTGSEATSAAVIKDRARNLKISFSDPAIMPNAAILDPELTMSMPPSVTAGTGMDALAHAIESLHSTNSQPISEGAALQAAKMIFRSLPAAVANGADAAARGEMLLASFCAGTAFSNTLVGIVHAAAHACGAECGVPHGTACGLLLPYGMEFNIEESEDAYAAAAAAMGVAAPGMNQRDAAVAAVRAVRGLNKKIGLPQSLKDAGVPENALPALVEKALMDGTMFTNPIQPDEEMMAAFFRKAWNGVEPLAGDAKEEASAATAAPPSPADSVSTEKTAEPSQEPQPAITLDAMYKVADKFARKLFLNPKVTEQLQKSGIIVRFIYFNENWGDEEAVLTVDCSADPIAIHLGKNDIEPVVSMRMHTETARLFWLQKVNIMSAISKGEIAVMGKVNEAMRLLPVIRPGFSLFKEMGEKKSQ
ncbi:MAG TPA: iron-containing alcohol dehydrogenase [bacterium]|nr:iron-containing alcohol dehydrogenase [bacterium]